MARKKTKHSNIPQETLDRARREAAGEVYTPQNRGNQAQTSAQSLSTNTHKTTYEDLVKEYSYVLTDLRSMGWLAAALFAVLIALSFIL